jgi:UPF0755 protein
LRYIIIFLLILLLSTSIASFFAWRDFISPNNLSQETTVILPRGTGFKKSIEILVENNIISHPLVMSLFAYANGDAKRIKAGEYNFPAAISPREVLHILVSGQVVKHKITFAEGLNVREITALLRAESILEGDIPLNIEEGALLPETYHFTYGDTRASLVARMQEKMQQTLSDLWEKRADNLPLKNKQEALILASIVEKETGVAIERSRVAAVFINRLKRGMKLQTDPTVAYGIEKATGKPLDRALMTSDLRAATPYNTYIIDALPPTPIANPSSAAIEAVLHPLETDELFFVATGSGGHNFSSSIAEHNRNVREYRKKIKR